MFIETVRNCKNHIILYTVLILLLMALMQNANAQLEVFDRNPNYLTYNGEVKFLVCAVPLYHDFHVMDFPLDHIDTMKVYGANHVWVMIESFTRCKWTYTINTPASYWEKLEAIVSKCHENDIMVGISFFGYGLIKYFYMYSFNKACTGDCDESPGPLINPEDFYNINKFTPDVVEAREGQKYIMRKIADYTWDYPNVYYSPGWELNCIWNTNVAQWYRWFVDFMKDYGQQVNPNVEHLFAIERTTPVDEAFALGADFIIDEDGNAEKVEGIPFVYWSMDGVWRGSDFWNANGEPGYDWDSTRVGIVRGAAGIASMWGFGKYEKPQLRAIANFAATVENWIDEPGQEITMATIPVTPEDNGIDLPGSESEDYVDYSQFEISNVITVSGNECVVDYSMTITSPYYSDRDYGLYFIPPDFNGMVWLKTPNDDKRLSTEPYLRYSINMDAKIFVGYDTRLTTKPDWLSDWTPTGKYVVDLEGVEFELLSKEFTAGQVELGANNGGSSSCSMYIVIHKPTGLLDETAPATPTNVTLTPF